MKNQKNKNTLKGNRHRYFHLIISLGLRGTSNFIVQKVLEMILYYLKIKDRGRLISIKNFDGQLECDSRGVPYWNVYLQTTALITSRRIAKQISKELFKTQNSIDPSIHISPLNNFQQCEREKLFSIHSSDFYPGYFSQTLLRFEELLNTEEIKEAIKERPEKYRILIENRDEIKNI